MYYETDALTVVIVIQDAMEAAHGTQTPFMASNPGHPIICNKENILIQGWKAL